MIRAVKYPTSLASLVCGERVTSKKGYNVNELLPAIELYLILKSESHKIHHFQKQLPYLCWLTKLSHGTFRKQLKACIRIGVIKREGNHLILIGWQQLGQLLLIDLRNGYKFLKYDLSEEGKRLRYLVKAAEITENEERQTYVITKKLTAHPESLEAFRRFCEMNGIKCDFTHDNYEQVKKLAFTYGTESGDYALLQVLNLSTSRNVKTYAKAHGYKHWQGGIYTKRRLAALGLITIKRYAPSAYKYNKKPERNTTKGVTKFGRFYDRFHKTAFWFKPDELIVSNAVFTQVQPAKTTQNTRQKPTYV